MSRLPATILVLVVACRSAPPSPAIVTSGASVGGASAIVREEAGRGAGTDAAAPLARASLPLVRAAEVGLPGRAVRFDYQDIDVEKKHLVIAHMNDAQVVVVSTTDGSLVKVLTGVPSPRGVVVAGDVGRVFVTSSPHQLVIIDSESLSEIARVDTGNGPDGVAWDALHKIVGVSDQGDGAISLISGAGSGARKQVRLGQETGNVAFDASRALFWITVVTQARPDKLIAIDPVAAAATVTIPLAGCSGAHGLRIHPDHQSALIACEGNSKLARVDLGGAHPLVTAPTGADPDVLAIDPGLGWLYVAAESGDLRVFDLNKAGLVPLGSQHPGAHSHSVAVDAATHHLFFPLIAGSSGAPVLRIMKPTGT